MLTQMNSHSFPKAFAKKQRSASNLSLQGWMQSKVAVQTMSADQRTSLSALISYVARKSGENEFRVERCLADRFNVANAMCLPAREYDNAVCYLVNLI